MRSIAALPSVGIRSLAVSAPPRVLTNDHWRKNYPLVVARAEERLWMWKKGEIEDSSDPFERAMAPFVTDPFRGAQERRVLPADGDILELEVDASCQAMELAGLGPNDVDLLICTSFGPDAKRVDQSVGGAAFLAKELGLTGAAWNVESACSSSLIAFQTACSLVQSGQYRRVLVMTSCLYSRFTVEADPLAWGVGDAAVAYVVAEVPAGQGYLGGHTINSSVTCGSIYTDLEVDAEGRPRYRLHAAKTASKVLHELSGPALETCTTEALAKAGLGLAEVDFFIFNTPLAWYARFCADTLGVDSERTLSVYPLYANIGPALPGFNLLHAARWGKVGGDDLVLVYSVGSVSSCSAAVMRWGDVALGELPVGATLERFEALEARMLEKAA